MWGIGARSGLYGTASRTALRLTWGGRIMQGGGALAKRLLVSAIVPLCAQPACGDCEDCPMWSPQWR